MYFPLHSFDNGNEEALDLFNEGEVNGFAKAAYPLVSVLLHRYLDGPSITRKQLKYKAISPKIKTCETRVSRIILYSTVAV